MIKVENIETWGFEHAIRGMRNPMNSWDKSDSGIKILNEDDVELGYEAVREFVIGENDLGLMKSLCKASLNEDNHAHRKYLRQIFVAMDIIAPRYWWTEFDTYKVGTVSNSCSTMHAIHKKEFELDDFSHEHLSPSACRAMGYIIAELNSARDMYLSTKNKKDWWDMIQLLPQSYNQKRTVTMNYENVVTIIKQRTGHKLDEWAYFICELAKLPYVREIIDGE